MTPESIRKAIADAERFIKAAEECLATVETLNAGSAINEIEYMPPSKLSGALRRASMDLTRSLANMRQSRG